MNAPDPHATLLVQLQAAKIADEHLEKTGRFWSKRDWAILGGTISLATAAIIGGIVFNEKRKPSQKEIAPQKIEQPVKLIIDPEILKKALEQKKILQETHTRVLESNNAGVIFDVDHAQVLSSIPKKVQKQEKSLPEVSKGTEKTITPVPITVRGLEFTATNIPGAKMTLDAWSLNDQRENEQRLARRGKKISK